MSSVSTRWTASLLTITAQRFGGGPVGLDTLAAAISEESDTIMDVYEPYLLKIGFIQRTPRGRMLLRGAYEHIGLEPPSEATTVEGAAQPTLFDADAPDADAPDADAPDADAPDADAPDADAPDADAPDADAPDADAPDADAPDADAPDADAPDADAPDADAPDADAPDAAEANAPEVGDAAGQ